MIEYILDKSLMHPTTSSVPPSLLSSSYYCQWVGRHGCHHCQGLRARGGQWTSKYFYLSSYLLIYLCLLCVLFIYSFIHLFIHLFIYSFIYLFNLFIYLFIYLFTSPKTTGGHRGVPHHAGRDRFHGGHELRQRLRRCRLRH